MPLPPLVGTPISGGVGRRRRRLRRRSGDDRPGEGVAQPVARVDARGERGGSGGARADADCSDRVGRPAGGGGLLHGAHARPLGGGGAAADGSECSSTGRRRRRRSRLCRPSCRRRRLRAGPASVVAWVDHASVCPVEQHAAEGATTAPRCNPPAARRPSRTRIAPGDDCGGRREAARRSRRGRVRQRPPLTAQLADGLPFLEPTRLIAKVTSATPPEVVAEGSAASSADATAGSVGGGTDASYLLECPSLCASTSTVPHASLQGGGGVARRSRGGRAAAVAAAALAQPRGSAHARAVLWAVRRCGAPSARCPARR